MAEHLKGINMALLKSIKNAQKAIKFKLPNEVVDDYTKAVIDAKARGFRLDITDQIEKLVVSATKQAREEMEAVTAAT